MRDHAFARQARWYSPAQITAGQIPSGLRARLLDQGSLTQRIIDSCPGRFRVQVLGQYRLRPELSERSVLSMGCHDIAFIREVRLLCDERPWIFARSVIPQTTLTGPQRRLARLGNRPLGAILFADRTMRRSPVQLTHLEPGHTLHAHAVAGIGDRFGDFWGRRSLFFVGGKPLLVSEFFLPGCCVG